VTDIIQLTGLPFDASNTPCYTSGTPAYWDAETDSAAAEAATICKQHCTLTAECLAWAMQHEKGDGHQYRHGIYGGLTPKERGKLHRRQNRNKNTP